MRENRTVEQGARSVTWATKVVSDDQAALQQLVGRGAVIVAGIAPSDAAHVLGRLASWDRSAAEKALQLFARRRTSAGIALAEGAEALARRIVDQLTEQSAQTLLEAAFAEDSYNFDLPVGELARHVLTRKGLDHHRGVVALDVGLNLPVIGLGVAAHSYYGAVGKRLNCKVVVPEHAGVANAIGAVVGQISMRLKGQITSVGEGRYRVHFIAGPRDFGNQDEALTALEKSLGDAAWKTAQDSGAVGIRLRFEQDITSA